MSPHLPPDNAWNQTAQDKALGDKAAWNQTAQDKSDKALGDKPLWSEVEQITKVTKETLQKRHIMNGWRSGGTLRSGFACA